MNTEINLTELAKHDIDNEDCVFSLDQNVFNLPLRIERFFSEKELDSFIKNVERLVRNSQEYRLWVEYVTKILNNVECVLTHEKINECSLSVHHHPIMLYDICKAVIDDFQKKDQKFSTFDTALKVIELHYQNRVGYMLLLSNLHEKFHAGFQPLPIELVKGNYKYILEHYKIDDDSLKKIHELCTIKSEDCKLNWGKDNYPGLTQKAS